MAKIKVVAGDLDAGAWDYNGLLGVALISRFVSVPPKVWPEKVTIDLKAHAESVELLTEEKVKKLAGMAGWGVAGAVLLGPLGAIGGLLIGGNKKEVAFVCNLKDGRKFMATTDGKTWQKILAATFKQADLTSA